MATKYKNIKNILLINFGGIGDEILFLPTITSLNEEFPDAKITLALEPRSMGIKDLTDKIDELFEVDVKSKNKYSELLKLVKFCWQRKFDKKPFDMVISSGSNKFISILLLLTGIKIRYGYDSGALSEITLTRAIALNKNQYACDMYHDLISDITEVKTSLPQISIKQQEKIPNSVLVHPGVSKLSVKLGMIKTICPKTWAETINLLLKEGKTVILAGGPDDKECIDEIREFVDINADNFQDYYGKTKNLIELAELISRAEKFLCSDSAPLHIAVALKTKTYAIFGPTDSKKLIPESEDVVAIKSSDSCALRPCLWDKRQKTCEELSCLAITPQGIIEIIDSK